MYGHNDGMTDMEREMRIAVNEAAIYRLTHKRTNAECIRSMSDEKLGIWICKHALSCGCCVGAELCSRDGGIANGAIKWLQQPAEEADK